VTTDSPVGVLREVRAHREAADAHEAAILKPAAEWADLHPPESPDDAAYVEGTEGELGITGEGTPLLAEFACAIWRRSVVSAIGSRPTAVGSSHAWTRPQCSDDLRTGCRS
jgi:hypothetical protein